MSLLPFQAFPKIARLKRDITVTEKIDGTNGQIYIRPEPEKLAAWVPQPIPFEPGYDTQVGDLLVRAGSRNRWLPNSGVASDDNFGFGRWVHDNAHELALLLGEGSHFGEWWGAGIQRRYGLTGNDKRFSLFNTHRWGPPMRLQESLQERLPGLGVVPVLYQGPMMNTDLCMLQLMRDGSHAVPGFMNPEGIIVYHHASRTLFKQTIEKDEEPKGKAACLAEMDR